MGEEGAGCVLGAVRKLIRVMADEIGCVIWGMRGERDRSVLTLMINFCRGG